MKEQRRLLIVDDEPDICEILSDLCAVLTMDIRVAANGEEALEILSKEPIDCILSDINMPRMSGLELLKELRARGLETPFVIVSGYEDKLNTVESLQLGALDFIDKPFDEKKLLPIVDIALELGHAIRHAESEVEKAYQNSQLPFEALQRLKHIKRSLWVLKKDYDLHNRKKSA